MGSPIRVLQVLAGMNRGGAESFIMNVYRNIDRSKVQFDFILFREEECDFNDEIRNLGGKIYFIPRYNGKNYFKFKKAWSSFFKKHSEYRIIHGHVRSTASIYLRIANRHGLITIAHSHSSASRGNRIEKIVKNIIQFQIRFTANYLFACSYLAGKWLFGNKAIKKDKFEIVNNAIESDRYISNESARKKYRRDLVIENKLVIGHIGSFSKPKNHFFLIDIFKAIHDKNENTVLLLVGDGELRSSIEQKIRELKLLGNVILTGVRSDIPELLQAMDVFVFPSLFEGLGIVTVEAQASGLPCIVADTIPQEAYVTDLIEKISLKDSPAFWADKVLEKVNYKRKNTRQDIIENGFDIKITANWIEDFYIKILMKPKQE